MDKTQTIFDVLNARNVCYSVCKSYLTFKNTIIGGSSKVYHIIALSNSNINELGFFQSDSYKDLLEREMTKQDIEYFFSIIDSFTKVLDNQDGTIWEQKRKSFKEYRQSQIQPLIKNKYVRKNNAKRMDIS